MPIVPIPLTGGAYTNMDKQEIANPEFSIALDNALLNIVGSNVGRPGLSNFTTVGGSPIIGTKYFNSVIVAVTADRQIHQINSAGVVTNKLGSGGLLGGTGIPVFATDGTYLAVAGGGFPQRWDGAVATGFEIMPGGPFQTTHIVYLDGYWMTFNGEDIVWAGPTALSRDIWSAANFFQAEGRPDAPNALVVLQRELFIFGEKTTEVWSNFGDVSVPFRRVFFMDIGTVAPLSITQAESTLVFLDDRRRFSFFNGRQPQVVSFPFDKQVQQLGTVSDCIGHTINIDGHYLVVFSLPTEAKTFVFDYTSQKYIGEWYGFDDSVESRFRMSGYSFFESQNKHYVGDYDNGTVWELSLNNHSDGTVARRVLRRTGEIDHGTGNLKRNIWYRFHLKRGVGNAAVTHPVMSVRFRDDGKPWSNPVHVSMGAVGDDESTYMIHNTGMYRKRQIEVSCTDAVEFKLIKVEENVDLKSK